MTTTFQQIIGDLAVDTWAEPIDLLRPVVARPLNAASFPASIADYAQLEAANAGHDTSAYLMASTTALAGAIDDGLQVEVRSGYLEPARLWGVLIGEPGSGKTPAARSAVAPLVDVHTTWQAEYVRDRAVYEQLLAAGEKATRPKRRSAVVDDSTVEALSETLIDNPRGILMKTEELEGWLGAHDCYRANGSFGPDRAVWIGAYDGGGRQIDRVKRGPTWVPNFGVSVLTATTPDALEKLARKLPADGLFARFLPVLIAQPVAPEHVDQNELARLRLVYADRCRQLVTMPVLDPRNPAVVKLSPEARALMDSQMRHERDILAKILGLSSGFAAHVAKGIGQVARIALVFHCATALIPRACMLSVDMLTVPMTLDTLMRAIQVQRQLRRHAWEVHGGMLAKKSDAVRVVRSLARSLVASEPVPYMRRTEMSRTCKAFEEASDAQRREVLAAMTDAGWMRPSREAPIYRGEPSTYELNPTIFDRFREYGAAHRDAHAAILRNILGE